MTWAQRQELHAVLNFTSEPCAKPEEYFLKQAILCFLNGEDAQAHLEKETGLPEFQLRRAVEKARVWLGNVRAERRTRGAEIQAERDRLRNAHVFTSENFRVTVDNSQNRNYGMANVSIYCLVEVWEENEKVEAEKEYLVNFSDYKTKEWLTRLLVWALMNSREVVLKPATEAEMSSMKMFIPKERVLTA